MSIKEDEEKVDRVLEALGKVANEAGVFSTSIIGCGNMVVMKHHFPQDRSAFRLLPLGVTKWEFDDKAKVAETLAYFAGMQEYARQLFVESEKMIEYVQEHLGVNISLMSSGRALGTGDLNELEKKKAESLAQLELAMSMGAKPPKGDDTPGDLH